jgi:hypothetical protein
MASATSRRDLSASSASADQATPPQALAVVASSEDEAYFSDPATAFPASGNPAQVSQVASPVDPNKVILSAYLMKRSKGRGRKVWRKRWFYLTSQGLSYTKSHMVSCHVISRYGVILRVLG